MRNAICLLGASTSAVLAVVAASWVGAQEFGARHTPEIRDNRPGQSGEERLEIFFDVLRRMDADGNGLLDSDEISDRARPYIDRCARLARLDPAQAISIDAVEAAFRQEYRRRNGPTPDSTYRVPRPIPQTSDPVPGFGPVDDLPPIPGFGVEADSEINVEASDLERAAERLRRYDTNHDGFLDRAEIGRGRWYEDPYQNDLNHDGRLSQRELALRYARRRISEASRDGPRPDRRPSGPSSRGQSDRRSADAERQRAREEEQQRRRRYEANRETWRLAMSLMARYDLNRDGVLQRSEWRSMGITSAGGDTDANGRISRGELAEWLVQRSSKSSQALPRGLPDWFVQRDLNGDGQVMMAEFAEEWTEQKASEFAKYDLNRDGIVMPQECLDATSLPGGTYASHQLQVIPARGTVYSEIEIPEGVVTSDLDVQLSVTHTWDECLDVFLIGPDEERIELFTGVGGSDDHFSNTILDDEAPTPIVRGRPPFSGKYHPEAVSKRQPSLRRYYGKDISGTWTLMVRAERSERPGALHGWSLITKSPDAADTAGEDEDHGPPPQESRWRGRGGSRWGPPREPD